MATGAPFDWLNPFASIDLDIGTRADGIKDWAITHREYIQPLKAFFGGVIVRIEDALQAVPPVVMIVILALIAWQVAGRRVAFLVLGCLMVLGLLTPTAWSLAMTTLAIVISSVLLCAVLYAAFSGVYQLLGAAVLVYQLGSKHPARAPLYGTLAAVLYAVFPLALFLLGLMDQFMRLRAPTQPQHKEE